MDITQAVKIISMLVGMLVPLIGFVWWLHGKFSVLEKKITETDITLGKKITEIENDLGKKITETDNALGKKITEINSALEKKITETRQVLEQKIRDTNNIMGIMCNVIRGIVKTNETIVSVLVETKLVSPNQQTKLFGHQVEVQQSILGETTNWLEGKTNPIPRSEADRFKKYVDMLRNKEKFSVEEAKDFQTIIYKLYDEADLDADAPWNSLLTIGRLAAFALGMALREESEQSEKEAAK
ncbi:MAG: hypothetical protein AB1797_06040 [bacterium]